MFNLVDACKSECTLIFSDYTVVIKFSSEKQSAEIREHSKLTVFDGCLGNGEKVRFVNNLDLKRTYLSEDYLIHDHHLGSSRINEGPFLTLTTPAWCCYVLSDENYEITTVLITTPNRELIKEWRLK